MNNKVQDDIWEWAKNTFPNSKTDNHLNHLLKEIEELRADPKDLLEYADCFIILLHVAKQNGVTVDLIQDAVKIKMDINKKRNWTQPDKDGAQHHIEEEPC
tara:strand:+ start:219 stop:521 length:303 start_codon:yes stop_codon:yes gene_type:complete